MRGFRYGVREFYTFNLQSSLAFEEEERGLLLKGFEGVLDGVDEEFYFNLQSSLGSGRR